VEYLSESRAKITWKATRCNFAGVKKINIQQAGSDVLSYAETNWNNETEIGYQIVENITVVANQTYFWNVSVVYDEGVEEATSQTSPIFEAVVVGKLRVQYNMQLLIDSSDNCSNSNSDDDAEG
jgi:hypothetical protein